MKNSQNLRLLSSHWVSLLSRSPIQSQFLSYRPLVCTHISNLMKSFCCFALNMSRSIATACLIITYVYKMQWLKNNNKANAVWKLNSVQQQPYLQNGYLPTVRRKIFVYQKNLSRKFSNYIPSNYCSQL